MRLARRVQVFADREPVVSMMEGLATLRLSDQDGVRSPPIELPLAQLEPGDLVAQTFRILRRLGSGAMGVVYQALDERLDRDAALKIMRPSNFDVPHLRRRFEAEAQAMASVRHPNVVEIYTFGYLQRAPYFVMEYVDGRSLGSWRREHPGPLPFDVVLGILDPLCRGVQAIHERGTAHRDVKPGNILIGPAFRVALADFGLARRFDEKAGTERMLAGTPAYMAPEVAAEREVEPELAARVDVYALGVVAFELLADRRPVDGSSAAGMLQAKVFEEPHCLEEYRDDLPSELTEILACALRRDPRERTPSAEAFRRALDRCSRAVPGSGTKRVLVVDDDPEYRELVATMISSEGIGPVTEASDGASALEVLDAMAEPPDLVITDLCMPVVGAAGLVAELRQRERTRNVPVLVVTGLGGAPDWALLKQHGASAFLVKPIDRSQLLSTVRRLVSPAHVA